MTRHKKAACHPKLPHYCKGLCRKCYEQDRWIRLSSTSSKMRGRVNYKRPGYLEETMSTWEDKLSDPDLVANIIGAVFGNTLKSYTKDDYCP